MFHVAETVKEQGCSESDISFKGIENPEEILWETLQQTSSSVEGSFHGKRGIIKIDTNFIFNKPEVIILGKQANI